MQFIKSIHLVSSVHWLRNIKVFLVLFKCRKTRESKVWIQDSKDGARRKQMLIPIALQFQETVFLSVDVRQLMFTNGSGLDPSRDVYYHCLDLGNDLRHLISKPHQVLMLQSNIWSFDVVISVKGQTWQEKKKILSHLSPCDMWTLTSGMHFFSLCSHSELCSFNMKEP